MTFKVYIYLIKLTLPLFKHLNAYYNKARIKMECIFFAYACPFQPITLYAGGRKMTTQYALQFDGSFCFNIRVVVEIEHTSTL